ncbi:MAG: GTPase HflX [Alphaproteobacteria bacterium]|nr:GTPase HflX [Alphaproteobacteria bacterium]
MFETQKIFSQANTMVLHPTLKVDQYSDSELAFRLEEAVGLAHAIHLTIIHQEVLKLSDFRPSTFITKGKVEGLKEKIKELEIELVIVDHDITPIQQKNLEGAWECKVIDRTGLILEIFGERAATREGLLQVELASLEYQKGRLVRTWTHLERQRGGFGFMGGPGESQIEADRRLIRERIARIKGLLETVVRTRELHRKSRRQVPYPVIALVGYTNAGKSTLFNALTGADVLVENKLFATLDPTMRVVKLPSGRNIILSDTVGFVSRLPTQLVAAFRATLEEVVEADLLLHVRDISHPQTEEQKDDVEQVIKSLGIHDKYHHHTIEVLNKIDRLECMPPISNAIPVSAAKRINLDLLLDHIDNRLKDANIVQEVTIPYTDGKIIAWIYEHAEIISRQDTEESIQFILRISDKHWAHLKLMLPQS